LEKVNKAHHDKKEGFLKADKLLKDGMLILGKEENTSAQESDQSPKDDQIKTLAEREDEG